MRRFAFAGRCSTEDLQDPQASRNWQLTRAKALIEPVGGRIVAEYFDIDLSRNLPWKRRPQAAALLAELRNPDRGFDAVVIGEPQRVFYGNQYSLTFPLFVHYGVELWVPEVGGRIDSESEAHDMIMSVFGGMSKAERARIKIRVRAAMAAQAHLEGRFLGGRSPYGYQAVDAGPHPNPSKAADGRKLRRLEPDPAAAPIVRRIYAEYLSGRGLYAIAEDLTRDGIPSPSAHDRARNPHREGTAWAKSAIRTILTNPRYTGHQVWNKQRKQETLLDVEDVALGYQTRMRWNSTDQWVWSAEIVHTPLISLDDFHRAQAIAASGTRIKGPKDRPSTTYEYLLRGLVHCHLCGRKMISQRSHQTTYYRCRYPDEYALANKVAHPRNITVRESDVVPALDAWLARHFAPSRREATIDRFWHAQNTATPAQAPAEETPAVIKDCDRTLARYRTLIDSGAADLATVAQWIRETEARRATAQAQANRACTARHQHLTRDRIAALVHSTADAVEALRTADRAAKARLYRALGLRMTYHHAQRKMQVRMAPDLHPTNIVGERYVSEGRFRRVAHEIRPFQGNCTWRSGRRRLWRGIHPRRGDYVAACLNERPA